MRSRFRRLVPFVLTAAALGLPVGSSLVRRAPVAVAQEAPKLPPVEVAIVATPHDEDAHESEVRLVAIDAAGLHEARLAKVTHARGATPRGDLLPGSRAIALAVDREGARGDDYVGELVLVDASGARQVARNVCRQSRPLASRDGQVYVERGSNGPDPTEEGHLRDDFLRVDAVDPVTGSARTLYAFTGYALHLAGEIGDELFVYRVGYRSSDIVAVERATGKSRLVASVPPFARDFSVDERAGALVFTDRAERDEHAWVVERIDAKSGAVTRLVGQRGAAPSAFALHDGSVAVGTPTGLVFVGAKSPRDRSRAVTPLGSGFDATTHESGDDAYLAIFHVGAPGAYDVSSLVHVATGSAVRLSARDERVEIVGFVGGSNGGVR